MSYFSTRLFSTSVLATSSLALLLLAVATTNTGCSAPPPPAVDTTVLVSEDFDTPVDTTTYIPIIEEPKKRRRKGSGNNSGNNSNSSGNNPSPRRSVDTQIQTDKPRTGETPIDFARAVQWRLIAMLYTDPCRLVALKVLDSKENEAGQLEIQIDLSWQDKWVRKPYQITGVLTVGKDGSKAVFKLLSANPEAEALQVGIDNFRETLDLGNI
jgi:hypothetical protein